MIYAFTGKTGSGKTWHMVHEAFKYWRAGVDIYSNTVLNFKQVKPSWIEYIGNKIFGREIVRGRIFYFENIDEILEVQDGLILFDEAQVLFNARQWESLSDEFQYKLQQHRKHKLDLFCTTQNMGTIDIAYRRLVQVWYHHEPVFGIGSFFLLHRFFEKDIDMLYNSIDDLKVDNLSRSFFFISRFRKTLYDTLYDIGFKRFKTLWLTSLVPKTHLISQKAYIIPKKMSLKDVSSALYTFQLSLNRKK